jgi:hypothetical protein
VKSRHRSPHTHPSGVFNFNFESYFVTLFELFNYAYRLQLQLHPLSGADL